MSFVPIEGLVVTKYHHNPELEIKESVVKKRD